MYASFNRYPDRFLDTLCDVHSQFSGGEQHDAMELFDSVTDILHEDLNRVIVKEVTEPVVGTELRFFEVGFFVLSVLSPLMLSCTSEWRLCRGPLFRQREHDIQWIDLLQEDTGQPDVDVARASWANHLKRNNSIVTDLFQGQFKSRLTCPNRTCLKRHVRTFDVFSSIACPIPGPPPVVKVVRNVRIYRWRKSCGGCVACSLDGVATLPWSRACSSIEPEQCRHDLMLFPGIPPQFS